MAISIDLTPVNVMREVMRRCSGGFVAVVFFSFAINLLLLTAPIYMLQVFDRVLTSRSIDTFVYLTLVAAFAFLILWGLEGSLSREVQHPGALW